MLDGTDPGQVARAVGTDLDRTVVVVSSKSGSTVETDSQRRAFVAAFEAAGIDPTRRVVVVTDPGSPLFEASTAAGYRKVFTADPDVGGRYSALTAFGLVPSGLAGADVGALLDDAEEALAALAAGGADNPGLVLGAALGASQNDSGTRRDKLAIVDDGSGLVGLGDWAEQLIAESTGKDGTGRAARRGRGRRAGGHLARVRRARRAPRGQPPPRTPPTAPGSRCPGPLGAQLVLWEYATAVAGRLLGINPFDQPDVESAKKAARGLLDAQPEAEDPAFVDDGIEVQGHRRPAGRAGHARGRGRRAARPARRRRLPRGDGLPRPRGRRRPGDRAPAARAAHRAPGHVRVGTALPALDRPVPQGRSAAGRLPPDHLRPSRSRPGDPGAAVLLRHPHRRAGGRGRPGARRARTAGAAPAPHRPRRPAAAARPGAVGQRRAASESRPRHVRPQPAARPARQAAAEDRRAVLPGAVRRHRRPVAQEADAGDLRPRQPRPAAARVLARRLRPARLGRPGLRPGRPRLGARARPHPVPGVGLEHPRRGLPVRPRRLLRRRRLRPAGATPSSELSETRGTGGNTAFYLSIPPGIVPGRLPAARRARALGPGGRRGRPVAAGGHREAVRPRPGERPGAEQAWSRRSSRRTRSSGSTTTSARRPSRTSWRSGSPTSSGSRSGTRTTWTTCRSRWPRTSASAAGPGTTTASAPRAT